METRWKGLPVMQEAMYDEDGVQITAEIGADGKEYGDPVPYMPETGVKLHDDMTDLIKRLIAQESFNAYVRHEEFETMEEADDFDIEDDPLDPLTPYEEYFMPARERPGGQGRVNTPDASPDRESTAETSPRPSDKSGNSTPADKVPTDQQGSSK